MNRYQKMIGQRWQAEKRSKFLNVLSQSGGSEPHRRFKCLRDVSQASALSCPWLASRRSSLLLGRPWSGRPNPTLHERGEQELEPPCGRGSHFGGANGFWRFLDLTKTVAPIKSFSMQCVLLPKMVSCQLCVSPTTTNRRMRVEKQDISA